MNKTENIKINEVLSVYDGDTFRGRVNAYPKWFGENVGFRIYGIDTPEKGWRAKCKHEKELAEISTTFAKEWLLNAKEVMFDVVGWDKYGGRIDVNVRVDGEDYATKMIELGYAKPYYGKKKESWCN